MMFLVGLSAAMQLQSVQALAPLLVAQAGLSYAEIGVLAGVFMLPGVFLAVPGGMLAARLGDRRAMAIALALMLASGVVMAVTGSYTTMIAARLIGGAGSAVLTTQSLKVVTDWFAGREISTAMAINAASFGLGIGVATGLLSGIAAYSSWQAAMWASAALTGVALAMVLAIYRDPQVESVWKGPAPAAGGRPGLQLSLHEFVLALLAAVMRMLFASGYVLFMSFAPVLLIARGMGVAEAGFLVSLSAVVALASVPLGGVLTDRTKRPNVFITLGALGAACCCFMLPQAAVALPWILLFGLLRGGCTGGIMALPSEVLRPGSRNAGFGVSSTMYFVGLSAIPPLAGWILDATRKPEAPIWFAMGLWLMIPLTLLVFRVLQRLWIAPR
ncbi:MAG: MFS transporter [Proteobacteria bacterium]|nr:MFS transporter [Pseudomonadota bacterium]